MSNAGQYDEDYYLHGKQTGKSLYEDYRWLPDLTIPMAKRMIDYIGISENDTVLDFGCARGYTVKALRLLGRAAFGVDISKWAVENADEETKPYLGLIEPKNSESRLLEKVYDWIIAKDVLEHTLYVSLVIDEIVNAAVKGVFAVVPLSLFDGADYVISDYEKDVTHVQRHRLITWVSLFLRPGWRVEASYRLPGIKDNWYRPGWEKGNGFILAQRVEG